MYVFMYVYVYISALIWGAKWVKKGYYLGRCALFSRAWAFISLIWA